MRFLFLFLILAAQGWGATYRIVRITGSTAALTNYQVRVDIAATVGMQADFSDVRFYDSTKTAQLNFWIQEYVSGVSAIAWVKVPNIPPDGTVIYMSYGDTGLPGGSDGVNTFGFFDDFENTNYKKYPSVATPTTALTTTQAWETTSPHTLTVVELNKDPGTGTEYKYWGYYGLQSSANSAIGLAFSQDGLTWTKYESNPILGNATAINYRWASGLISGGYVYLTVSNLNGGIELWRSAIADGIVFESAGEISAPRKGSYIFSDPESGDYYIYYHGGVAPNNTLYYKTSETVEGLISATEQVMMTSNSIDPLMPGTSNLAAPAVIYADSKYFLTVEDQQSSWANLVFVSDYPIGPWEFRGKLNGGGAGVDGYACWLPSLVGSAWHAYTCHQDYPSLVWDVEVAVLDLATITTSTWKGLWQTEGSPERSTDYALSGTYSAKLPYAALFVAGAVNHAPLVNGAYRWDYSVYIPTLSNASAVYHATSIRGGPINVSVLYGVLARQQGDSDVYALIGSTNTLQDGYQSVVGWNKISAALIDTDNAYFNLNGVESFSFPTRFSTAPNSTEFKVSNIEGLVTAVSYIDDVRLRKYASPEPVATVSSGGRNKSRLMLLVIGR